MEEKISANAYPNRSSREYDKKQSIKYPDDFKDIQGLIERASIQKEKPEYEMVNHPSHYNNYSKEVIDMMVAIYGKENTALFCEMNAFKYRMRMGTKPNNSIEQDLKKEKWYLDKAKELR